MLKKIIACTIALGIVASLLCGAVSMSSHRTTEHNVTLCDFDYVRVDS